MMDDKDGSKLRDMDLFLKENLVNLWFKAIDLSINGSWKQCFLAYKSMFHMIEPYNFSSKVTLAELVQVIGDYLKALGSKPLNMQDVVGFNEKRIVFRELMDELMSLLPKAFVDLDLWFKSVPTSNDYDQRFSIETFGDETSLIDKKRKALTKLSSSGVIALLSINAIHDAHSRGVFQNVL